mmetsp:Transcript_30751/g.95142  ORF Transcript_30751/g.95142 Transcript_30751/m.95142 type:complete len:97 (+) Transcript_30751:90-380(+)
MHRNSLSHTLSQAGARLHPQSESPSRLPATAIRASTQGLLGLVLLGALHLELYLLRVVQVNLFLKCDVQCNIAWLESHPGKLGRISFYSSSFYPGR